MTPRNYTPVLPSINWCPLLSFERRGHDNLSMRSSFLFRANVRQLFLYRYCDASQRQTEEYPHNPNGSPEGIAGLCSSDGRHLAMMPHPERCFLAWQNPWYPADTNLQPDGPSPWLKLFQNAQKWCESWRSLWAGLVSCYPHSLLLPV